MNREEFARLYHQTITKIMVSEVMVSELKVEEPISRLLWEDISDEMKNVFMKVADIMLEQTQAPLRAELTEILGTEKDPRMVISVEYIGDKDFDTVRLIESSLEQLDDTYDKVRVLSFVKERATRLSGMSGDNNALR